MGLSVIGKPISPQVEAEILSKILDVPKMPTASEKDELFAYVICIHPDAPFSSEAVAGVSFSKYVLPRDATLEENEGKAKIYSMEQRLLTKKQAKYLRERSLQQWKKIPRKSLPAEWIIVGDWLIIEESSKFDEKSIPDRKEEAKEILDVEQIASKALLEKQIERVIDRKSRIPEVNS